MSVSFGKSKETRKIKILVSLSLFVSGPRLGDQSLSLLLEVVSCHKLLHSRSC